MPLPYSVDVPLIKKRLTTNVTAVSPAPKPGLRGSTRKPVNGLSLDLRLLWFAQLERLRKRFKSVGSIVSNEPSVRNVTEGAQSAKFAEQPLNGAKSLSRT